MYHISRIGSPRLSPQQSPPKTVVDKHRGIDLLHPRLLLPALPSSRVGTCRQGRRNPRRRIPPAPDNCFEGWHRYYRHRPAHCSSDGPLRRDYVRKVTILVGVARPPRLLGHPRPHCRPPAVAHVTDLKPSRTPLPSQVADMWVVLASVAHGVYENGFHCFFFTRRERIFSRG